MRKLKRIIANQQPDIDYLGKFLIKLEEVYKMVTSQAFIRRISLAMDENMKKKLLKFIGTIVLLNKNTKEGTELLKKLTHLPISPFTGKKSKNTLEYDEDKLYSLYH